MESLGKELKKLRIQSGTLAREIAAALKVDASMVSRFESGTRLPTRNQVIILAELFEVPEKKLLSLWLAEKILLEIGNDPVGAEALALAEERVQYNNKNIEIDKNLKKQLQEIDVLKSKLDKVRQNDNFRLVEALAIEYTYESNKIEGNTLTLQETAMVINEGITISGKSMREHLEAINHYEAIGFIRDIALKRLAVTEKLILQLHHLVLQGIDKNNSGVYRKVQVRITGSPHTPPEPYLVPVQMESLLSWYNENGQRLHPVILAAEMHERLVSIHPFIDGNGRTSRLLMNLILLRHGFVIANLKGNSQARLEYYNALETARKDPDKTMFKALICQYEKQGLIEYLKYLNV